jgi:hypothetical protein
MTIRNTQYAIRDTRYAIRDTQYAGVLSFTAECYVCIIPPSYGRNKIRYLVGCVLRNRTVRDLLGDKYAWQPHLVSLYPHPALCSHSRSAYSNCWTHETTLNHAMKDGDAKYRRGTAYNPYIDSLDLFGRHGNSRGFWLRRRMLEAETARTEQDGLDR